MFVIPQSLEGQGLKIGIIQSRFSNEIGSRMLDICVRRLTELGVHEDNITLATVPGALEIPLLLQNMAAGETFDALIAIGTVIRGETYHFELVANESAAGISQIALRFNTPVINAVLTTENEEQAYARINAKATEAAEAAIECARLLQQFVPDGTK